MANDLKAKPLPDRQDIDNAPFWNGTDKDELQVKRCDDCSRSHWPPRLGCPYCGSGHLRWAVVAPKGKLFSWTIVHRSQTPGFEPEHPMRWCWWNWTMRKVFVWSATWPTAGSINSRPGCPCRRCSPPLPMGLFVS